MMNFPGKQVLKIQSFKDIDGLAGNENLVLDIDFSREIPENADYFTKAQDIIDFTELQNKDIDYRVKNLRHPDEFLSCRHDPNFRKICYLISSGATIVFGLSTENHLNTLCCLNTISILPIYPELYSERDDDERQCFDYMTEPCLIGYKLVNNNEELQWTLRWPPKISELFPPLPVIKVNDLSVKTNKLISYEDCDIVDNCEYLPPRGSSEYNEADSCASIFEFTEKDKNLLGMADNHRLQNIGLVYKGLKILRHDERSFIHAFFMECNQGRLIVTPEHCKDDVVAQFLQEAIEKPASGAGENGNPGSILTGAKDISSANVTSTSNNSNLLDDTGTEVIEVVFSLEMKSEIVKRWKENPQEERSEDIPADSKIIHLSVKGKADKTVSLLTFIKFSALYLCNKPPYHGLRLNNPFSTLQNKYWFSDKVVNNINDHEDRPGYSLFFDANPQSFIDRLLKIGSRDELYKIIKAKNKALIRLYTDKIKFIVGDALIDCLAKYNLALPDNTDEKIKDQIKKFNKSKDKYIKEIKKHKKYFFIVCS